MNTAIWILSFIYLAAISAWITNAVKPAEEGAPGLARRAAGFFVLVAVGTIGFCGIILLIEKLT